VSSPAQRMLLRTCSIVLFLGGCVSLYFAVGWLFLMPGFPGESYFTFGRMLPGGGYTLASALALILAGWVWGLASNVTTGKAIGNSLRFALAAVVLFWIVLFVIGGIRQG
jgi:hypothetical protein